MSRVVAVHYPRDGVSYLRGQCGAHSLSATVDWQGVTCQQCKKFKYSEEIMELTMALETRYLIHAALLEIVDRIEACGASPELTKAVALASDLRAGIGDRYNLSDPMALDRVCKALPGLIPITVVKNQLGHSVDDSTIDLIVRAFWRRIQPVAADYDRELPSEMPVEFIAHMSTALMLLRNKGPVQ